MFKTSISQATGVTNQQIHNTRSLGILRQQRTQNECRKHYSQVWRNFHTEEFLPGKKKQQQLQFFAFVSNKVPVMSV